MSKWDPRDDAPDNPPCPHCRGLGYWPANHDRGAIPCGCSEWQDKEEDEE